MQDTVHSTDKASEADLTEHPTQATAAIPFHLLPNQTTKPMLIY